MGSTLNVKLCPHDVWREKYGCVACVKQETAALDMATAAMRAWDEQLAADDGSFGPAEVRQAIRATLDAIAAVLKD
jgi:hypothetical protein